MKLKQVQVIPIDPTHFSMHLSTIHIKSHWLLIEVKLELDLATKLPFLMYLNPENRMVEEMADAMHQVLFLKN